VLGVLQSAVRAVRIAGRVLIGFLNQHRKRCANLILSGIRSDEHRAASKSQSLSWHTLSVYQHQIIYLM
jgi:hypothetical protein